MGFTFNGIPGAQVTISGGVSPTAASYTMVTITSATTTNVLSSGTRRLRGLVFGINGTGFAGTIELKDGTTTVMKTRKNPTNEAFPNYIDLGSLETTGAITIVSSSWTNEAYITLIYEDA